MPGPLLPLAIAGGVAGLVAYLARRRRSREAPVLAELAIRMDGARLAGEELTVPHRGIEVTMGFGVPEALPTYERGLFASAAYVVGGGPSFVASPGDVSAHTRKMGTGFPLSARFTRGYSVIGHHQEARALVLPVVARIDTAVLPAPLFVATARTIAVYLPEFMPADDKLEVAEQLVALTGELAFFGYEPLERLRALLGGTIVTHRSPMYLRTHRDEVPVDVAVTWEDPGTGVCELGLIIAASRGTRSVEIEDAIASLPTVDDRHRATQMAARSLRSDASRVAFVFDRMLVPSEIDLMLGLLVRLAGQVSRDSPFR
jgi:hypothetical protein